jgi:hypothetical protein
MKTTKLQEIFPLGLWSLISKPSTNHTKKTKHIVQIEKPLVGLTEVMF